MMKQKNPCTDCEARLSVKVADRPEYVCMLQPGDIADAQQTCVKWHNYYLLQQARG